MATINTPSGNKRPSYKAMYEQSQKDIAELRAMVESLTNAQEANATQATAPKKRGRKGNPEHDGPVDVRVVTDANGNEDRRMTKAGETVNWHFCAAGTDTPVKPVEEIRKTVASKYAGRFAQGHWYALAVNYDRMIDDLNKGRFFDGTPYAVSA